jgi:predicted nucleic acid-binding protein
MEVLAGAEDAELELAARAFLQAFDIAEVDTEVAELAIQLRRERRLRLPDAIILATAQQQGCLLITRNTKDFQSNWVEIRVPYSL